MADESVSIAIRLRNAAKFAADARKAAREIDEMGDAAQRADRKSRRTATSLNLVQRTIQLVKPAALITGLGLLTQVMSAAAGGGIGLAAALAPLGGLLLALPAALAGAGQGAGVLMLGFTGVAAAVGGLNSQLDPKKWAKLTGPARQFALVLQGAKAPIISLQKAVQRGLFPGLTEGIKAALPAVTALRGPLVGTANVFGTLGARLGKLVGSRGFLDDLASQASFNNTQFKILGSAGLRMVNVLRNLAVAARPLVGWIVRLTAGWAKTIDETVTAQRANGGLARMFHTVQVTLGRVVKIAGNLAAVILNIGRVGKRELGDSLLVSLVKGSRSLREWSSSAKGIGQITTYFRQAKPVVYAVGKLFAAIATAFLGFGAGGQQMAGWIDQIRTQFLPILVKVTQSTTSAFGPHLVDAIISLAKAFEPLAGSNGPLVLYVDALNGLGKALVFIEQHVPGGGAAISGLFASLAIVKTIRFASALTGITSLISGVKKAKAIFEVFKGTTTGVRIGLALLQAQEFATGITAAGMWAAITGPVALVVLGIVAVAAAFTAAYLKIGWFHRAVDSVVAFIKGHAYVLALVPVIGPLLATVGLIIQNFDGIVSFITGMPGRISDAARGMFKGIKDAADSVVHWVANRFRQLIDFIKRVPNAVADVAVSLPGKVIHGAGSILSKLPGAATGGLVTGPGSFMVGERGPELFTMYPGMQAARVDPLPAPSVSMSPVRQASGNGARRGGGVAQFVIHTHVHVDGEQVAQSTDQVVARQDALA